MCSTYSVCKSQIFKESQTLKKWQISNPTFQTLEYSKRQGFISTVNRLLKFHCLNNGFHSLEFKSKWFNNDDFLNKEPFFDDALQLMKAMNFCQKKLQSNLYKTTTLWTTQKWLSWTGGRLIKHL